MTFDEWWVDGKYQMEWALVDSARLVWTAATAVERERCARVAEGIAQPGEQHWIRESAVFDILRRETAAEIRREP